MKPVKAVQPFILIALWLSMVMPALALPAVQSSTHKSHPLNATKTGFVPAKPNATAHHAPKNRKGLRHHRKHNGAVHPHK